MTSPTLEPYRTEIAQRLRQGQTKAEIKKWLEQKHVNIGRSQFYAYLDQLSSEVAPPTEEEPDMPLREVKTPKAVLEDDPVRAFFMELPPAIQEMTGRLTALEHKAEEQQQMTLRALREFHETLTGFATLLQARPEQPASAASPVTAKPTASPPAPILTVTLRQIWKRAFIVSGVVWGIIDALFVWGYWRPLWAAIVK